MIYRLLVRQVVIIDVTEVAIYHRRRGQWHLTSQLNSHLTIVILCPLHWLERQHQTVELHLSEMQLHHITTFISQTIAVAKVLLWPQLVTHASSCLLNSLTTTSGGRYHVVKMANLTLARYLFEQDGEIEWQKTKRFCQRYGTDFSITPAFEEVIFISSLLQRANGIKQLNIPQVRLFAEALKWGRHLIRLTSLLVLSTAISLMTIRWQDTGVAEIKPEPCLISYSKWRRDCANLDWRLIDRIFHSFKTQLVLHELLCTKEQCILSIFVNPTVHSQISLIKARILELMPHAQIEVNNVTKSLTITYLLRKL